MKTVTTALFIVALLIVIGWEKQASASEQKEPPVKPPDVSLHIAALQGDLAVVRRHIKAGSDLNEKDAYGSTPLIIATTFGKPEVAKALIEAGAELNSTDNEGSTPLHIAAFLGRTEIVEALLDQGANKYLRNNGGHTALETVAAPFADVKGIYDILGQGLGPLGLELDYERIKAIRPRIAQMLRPRKEELEAVEYAPLPGNDWKASTPAEQGLEPGLVAELYLEAAELPTLYGLLVIRNDHLIAEGYFNEGAVDQLSGRQSATKSFVSALVGIALDKGCLSSVAQKMMDFFPEFADQITDPRKRRITIRDLLQMRAGYPWEERTPPYFEALFLSDNWHWLPHLADFPLIDDPGAEFAYSNLTSHLLAVIVARACAADLESYAQENLFAPIEAQLADWSRDADNYNWGWGEIYVTARDMARFGLLYLHHGQYEGNRVLAAAWVRESLQRYSENINVTGMGSSEAGRYFRDIGYGYQWWSARVGKHRFDFAWGHGGQLIVLLDELNMIIVTTADPLYHLPMDKGWRYEQAIINMVGKFIASLPKG